ncbi:aminoacyl-histidine dipeptidase [Parasporobacterium paucivorans]|uniref:Cytosol non-specific dipeptidase n=1 Tax=Parasporobacterium paucivorans DSM 15970 TaxID=1122934 RepID=A0A1M6F600_9FIRM|nr:aminoacyl-histidine dipeptidase [Parasporobacterium paucivorans]SHI93148.1 dipeptidase D [Parasporobacterium paucivorans DSM 15970]
MNSVKVFKYFEEISAIPRGSGNTKRISDYCASFARKRAFEYCQDEWNNIIIRKPASPGRENDGGVIIQGHLDMVAEKKPESEHDFSKDGIKLVKNGDFIGAEGTTLGGDNGIAIAYALAVLDDDTISHPALEAVFTVDEEIGMLGAKAIDLSALTGKYLLNIDSDEEDILLGGCAGGLTVICTLKTQMISASGVPVRISVEGLKGGHSGAEIDKERANADILLGRILFRLTKDVVFSLKHLEGGTKDNAIPRKAEAVLLVHPQDIQKLKSLVKESNISFQTEYALADPDIIIEIYIDEKCSSEDGEVMNRDGRDRIIFFLMNCPNGVYFHDLNIPEVVETSLNLGIMHMEGDMVAFTFSVRSSLPERKMGLKERLESLTTFLGGSIRVQGDYPAWRLSPGSKLLSVMSDIYQEMFNKKPEVTSIHAGLECGYILEKKPGLDIVSFGPQMYDIHTTEERMSISSVDRMYDYLIEILRRIK